MPVAGVTPVGMTPVGVTVADAATPELYAPDAAGEVTDVQAVAIDSESDHGCHESREQYLWRPAPGGNGNHLRRFGGSVKPELRQVDAAPEDRQAADVCVRC